jgi:hypothetical protein
MIGRSVISKTCQVRHLSLRNRQVDAILAGLIYALRPVKRQLYFRNCKTL